MELDMSAIQEMSLKKKHVKTPIKRNIEKLAFEYLIRKKVKHRKVKKLKHGTNIRRRLNTNILKVTSLKNKLK